MHIGSKYLTAFAFPPMPATIVRRNYALAACVAAILAMPVHAQTVVTLPDATVTADPSTPSGGFNFTYSLGSDPSLGASAGTYVIPPNPDTVGASGFVSLDYYYAVVGPVGGIYVPLTITGSVTAIASGVSGESEAVIDYANGGVNVENYGAGELTLYAYSDSPGTGGSATLNTTFDALTSLAGGGLTPLEIGLLVNPTAGTGGMVHGESSASATADPVLSLSPALLAEGYSIELSPNLTPVPLPSTWLMLLSGFVGFGLLASRRTKRGSAATAAV